MRKRAEQSLIEQLVTQTADERLGERILHRLARGDVMPGDLVIVRPSQDGVRGEFGSVVADNHPGLAALGEQPIELAGNPDAGDRGVGHQGQALARAVIDHDQDTHAAAVDELVRNEVERPTVVGPLWDEHRSPCAQSALASATAANHKALLPI